MYCKKVCLDFLIALQKYTSNIKSKYIVILSLLQVSVEAILQ